MPVSAAGLTFGTRRLPFYICQAWGGGDGILRTTGHDAGSVQETAPASMYVNIMPFFGFVDGLMAYMIEQDSLGPVSEPAGGAYGDIRRIDLVLWKHGLGVLIREGEEGPSPSPPDLLEHEIPLAHIVCRRGMQYVKNVDDNENGYIIDRRIML